MRQLLCTTAVCAVVICIGLSAVAQPFERSGLGPGAGSGSRDNGLPSNGPGGPPSNAMFNAIDADGDGTITMRELRKAVVALKRLDANHDGKITLAETMLAQNGPSGSAAPGRSPGQSGFGNGNSGGDPRPGGPDMMQYDRNGDGQLSADEVPTQMMGLVRGADQNGNGKLDPQELQAVQQRMNERVRGQRPLPPGISVGPRGVQRAPQ